MSGIARPQSRLRLARAAVVLAAVVLLGLAVAHLLGAGLDFAATVRSSTELDYGEGIVWQQALLMFGPRMYSASQSLPFIVFHYPPLYYAIVRALMTLHVGALAAGRLVSGGSVLASAAIVGGLVLASLRGRVGPFQLAVAVVCAALTASLHAVHVWGSLMRVDMVAIALGLAANLVAARARGRTWVLTLSLLLGVAAMFAKQTQLPAGASVFLVALVCWPRQALVAAAIALVVGLAAVGLLQAETHGFLLNIIGYNLNTYDVRQGLTVLFNERSSLPFVVVMCVTAVVVVWRLAGRQRWRELRAGSADLVTQAMVAVHFALACVIALAVFKNGSNFNYLLDPLTVGCVLVGIALCGLVANPPRFVALAAVLALSINNLPIRIYHDAWLSEWSAREAPLVKMIRDADKPVVSEPMVLIMEAGKSLTYEPAIVAELVATGRWDPAPLVRMFREHQFAFVIGRWITPMGGPVVAKAIEDNYPRLEPLIPGMFIRYPADDPAK